MPCVILSCQPHAELQLFAVLNYMLLCAVVRHFRVGLAAASLEMNAQQAMG